MFDFGQIVMAFLIGGVGGFCFGLVLGKTPSEEKMKELLVVAATERRMFGVVEKDLEHEINTRAEANINKTQGF